ncbi:hypothetical protein TNCV_3604781 [Trichonephila clavipes]|nr:hypothetical protein TNCV_3604781 [Trichonephila clavipes]
MFTPDRVVSRGHSVLGPCCLSRSPDLSQPNYFCGKSSDEDRTKVGQSKPNTHSSDLKVHRLDSHKVRRANEEVSLLVERENP